MDVFTRPDKSTICIFQVRDGASRYDLGNNKILYIMQAQRKINNNFHYPTVRKYFIYVVLSTILIVERALVRNVK